MACRAARRSGLLARRARDVGAATADLLRAQAIVARWSIDPALAEQVQRALQDSCVLVRQPPGRLGHLSRSDTHAPRRPGPRDLRLHPERGASSSARHRDRGFVEQRRHLDLAGRSDRAGGSGDAATADAEPGLKFDVPQDRCPDAQAGWRCDGATAIECDAQGEEIGAHSCLPGTCVDGQGCAACVPGQVSCLADKVRVCDDTVVPAAWRVVEVCDAAAGEACDVELVACAPAEVIGGTEPTGVYFRYASFGPDDDVDRGLRRRRLRRSPVRPSLARGGRHSSRGASSTATVTASPSRTSNSTIPDHLGAIEPRVLMLEDSILVETRRRRCRPPRSCRSPTPVGGRGRSRADRQPLRRRRRR
ncbi:MAG: hypothetical protein U0168_25970 [Nannocystaceae bacterium]